MMDPRRFSIESMPAEDRAPALQAKASTLHDLACRIQDMLNESGIFYGDGALLDAKKRIDAACDKARATAEKLRYDQKAAARLLKAVPA